MNSVNKYREILDRFLSVIKVVVDSYAERELSHHTIWNIEECQSLYKTMKELGMNYQFALENMSERYNLDLKKLLDEIQQFPTIIPRVKRFNGELYYTFPPLPPDINSLDYIIDRLNDPEKEMVNQILLQEKETINVFKALLISLQDVEEKRYEVIRKEALRRNVRHIGFYKNTAIKRLEQGFEKQDFIHLWFYYFEHLAAEEKRINEGYQDGVQFYEKVYSPIIDKVIRRKEIMDYFFEGLAESLIKQEFYEEWQMFKYYEETNQNNFIYSMVTRPGSVMNKLASGIPGYKEFIFRNNPRN